MLRSLGLFGLIMLMYKSGFFKWFFAIFRPVGQMAFTNYLMQSLIGALFFYGIGLNYFGKLERYELYIYTGSCLDHRNYLESYLVTLFPVWTIGMGMAKFNLLENTTTQKK